MTDYEDIRKLLYKLEDKGVEFIPETGATLIGRAPEIAPQAWLNKIFAPVITEQVNEIEEQIAQKMIWTPKKGISRLLAPKKRIVLDNRELRMPGPYVEFLTGFLKRP